MEKNKIYFLPGDLVTVRQELLHKPTMYVIKKVVKNFNIENITNDYFQGILCRWFTSDGELQEAVFNTKDLLKLN